MSLGSLFMQAFLRGGLPFSDSSSQSLLLSLLSAIHTLDKTPRGCEMRLNSSPVEALERKTQSVVILLLTPQRCSEPQLRDTRWIHGRFKL
jgi:hypothetical protein